MSEKKILICTIESWNSRVGANTFSTLFSNFQSNCLANIYIREELPDSHLCSRYFQISEMKVIKSIVNKKIHTGREVQAGAKSNEDDTNTLIQSRTLYNKNRKKRSYFKLCVRELMWILSNWKSKELDEFLDDYKPDIVVFGMEGYIHFNRLCRYIINRTNADAIGYFWDDNFTYKQMPNNIGYRILRYFQRKSLKKLVTKTDAFWAITEKTKEEADEYFGIDCRVLTKPIDYSAKEEWNSTKVHEPIQMLYTGNLLIGRFDTIKAISKALERINQQKVKIELNIYSASYIPDDEIKQLSKYVHMCGTISQSEVLRIQKEADVLLFAEAYQGEFAQKARLSFSTKLTDYFHSGKCIFAVGARDIAPIEYLRVNNVALCASNDAEIYECLAKLVADYRIINEFGQLSYRFGKENHSRYRIDSIIKETIDCLEV